MTHPVVLTGAAHHIAENPFEIKKTGWTASQNSGGQFILLNKRLNLPLSTAQVYFGGFQSIISKIR